MRRALALLALALALPAAAATPGGGEAQRPAESVVAAVDRNRVAITTSFSGSEIFIYGAIRRDAAPPPGPLNVIVTVIGPSTPVVIRKKQRRFGIWVNGPGVHVDAAPSFYAVATTGPFRQAISHTDELRYSVGLDRVIRLIGAPDWLKEQRQDFLGALVRIRTEGDHYFVDEGGVRLVQDTLFSTRVELPADLVEGDYKTQVLLTRDKKVVDTYQTSIRVRKAGIERLLWHLSRDNRALYGLGSLGVALAAGWLASTAFRIMLP